MCIKMIVFDSISIPVSLFSPHLQKLRHGFVPSVDEDPLLGSENQEPAYFEHVIFRLETVGDDMGPQRDEFDSFELVSDFPGNVVDSELDSGGTVQKEQHSSGVEPLIDVLLYHCYNYSNIRPQNHKSSEI